MQQILLQIAIPNMPNAFDYLLPENINLPKKYLGLRVHVPWRHKKVIGFIVGNPNHTNVPTHKLKYIDALIDNTALFDHALLTLCQWTSQYYHYPLGDVFATAIPATLRQGKMPNLPTYLCWLLTPEGERLTESDLQRAPKQAALIQLLSDTPSGMDTAQLKQAGVSTATIKACCKKKWIAEETPLSNTLPLSNPQTLLLNEEQKHAIQAIDAKRHLFQPFLLDGVTGSGKTEVYLQIIERVLKDKKQCLILIPEIGLTPQTVSRFTERFNVPIAVLHSGLNETEKLHAWTAAYQGNAHIVIGTRSAIFAPLPALGLIIIDEEHDASFKQQDHLRYSARDLALVRARNQNIPVILGSATPALETYHNAQQGRYQHLCLTKRAGGAHLPDYHIIDLRRTSYEEGLSSTLMNAMKIQLSASNQVLLYLNRRGYAPTLLCHHCGWVAKCTHCDARLTLHYKPRHLQCHHCTARYAVFKTCQSCNSETLLPLGLGTEKIELFLQKAFPDIEIIRVDRDTTRRKDAFHRLLDHINTATPKILIGTQMLAKGHHFPKVTLVGILDADSGFLSADFRACERMGQLITQVAGRAGRAEKPGCVYVQTHQPHNALLTTLITQSYHAFLTQILQEREQAQLPPHSHLALFRCETRDQDKALFFLEQVKKHLLSVNHTLIAILGPVPALMNKKAGFFRAQLLLKTRQRNALQQVLQGVLPLLPASSSNGVRWSLDIDPLDVF